MSKIHATINGNAVIFAQEGSARTFGPFDLRALISCLETSRCAYGKAGVAQMFEVLGPQQEDYLTPAADQIDAFISKSGLQAAKGRDAPGPRTA